MCSSVIKVRVPSIMCDSGGKGVYSLENVHCTGVFQCLELQGGVISKEQNILIISSNKSRGREFEIRRSYTHNGYV